MSSAASFICKLTKRATTETGRIALPASIAIGRAYVCNHADQHRTMLELSIRAADDERSQFVALPHPLCCQSEWARAAYYLAVRRLLRHQIGGRDNQQRAWRAIVAALHAQLPLPAAEAFWDIQREVSQERRHVQARSAPSKKPVRPTKPSMLKRKIGSRPLASRKLPRGRRLVSRPFATRKLASKPHIADASRPPKKSQPAKKPPPVARPVRPKATRAPVEHWNKARPAVEPATQSPVTSPSASPLASAPSRNSQLPDCFWSLGFETLPTRQQLRQRFLQLATVVHPDLNGTQQDFKQIKAAYELAVRYLNQTNPPPTPARRTDHPEGTN